ncbi:MAG TPA: DUF1579 domain-containing protein [Gammaproteobacteria bacterium]
MPLRPLLHTGFAFAFLATSMGAATSAFATQDDQQARQGNDLSGLHAFDDRVGCWTVHNRSLKERLAGSHDWLEYDMTQRLWLVMGGYGNVDDNRIDKPGGAYYGLTVRTYDPKTAEWSIWWFDGRDPSELDPPVKGRFVDGVGTFYSDDTLRGKPIKVRFTWSKITPTGAHWEQAFSADGGKTWETNWYADFKKVACPAG